MLAGHGRGYWPGWQMYPAGQVAHPPFNEAPDIQISIFPSGHWNPGGQSPRHSQSNLNGSLSQTSFWPRNRKLLSSTIKWYHYYLLVNYASDFCEIHNIYQLSSRHPFCGLFLVTWASRTTLIWVDGSKSTDFQTIRFTIFAEFIYTRKLFVSSKLDAQSIRT